MNIRGDTRATAGEMNLLIHPKGKAGKYVHLKSATMKG